MPQYDPAKDTHVESKEFDLIPAGDCVFVVENVEIRKSKAGNLMYALRLKPMLLVGNYGNVFTNLMESEMLHVLLTFCDAAGISKGHVFPPELRDASGTPNSFMDIVWVDGAPPQLNLLAENMRGRVVIGVVKQKTGQDGKPRNEINSWADPPFKPYIVNGEPYRQPALITGKPVQAPAQQRTIAPPPDDELEEDLILPDDTPTI